MPHSIVVLFENTPSPEVQAIIIGAGGTIFIPQIPADADDGPLSPITQNSPREVRWNITINNLLRTMPRDMTYSVILRPYFSRGPLKTLIRRNAENISLAQQNVPLAQQGQIGYLFVELPFSEFMEHLNPINRGVQVINFVQRLLGQLPAEQISAEEVCTKFNVAPAVLSSSVATQGAP